LTSTITHYTNESEMTIMKTNYTTKPKCVNCGKEFECVIYDGGQGEYGVYLICNDCDKLEFKWKYIGY